MLTQLFQFFMKHPGEALSLASGATFIVKFFLTGIISNLPAPTKDSTPEYVYSFKTLNWFMGNWGRAKSTHIENSPNWQAAVEAHVQKLADS